MAVALGRLRWTPDAFWRATPRELAAALSTGRALGPAAPDRPALDRLMALFPDGDRHDDQ